MSIFKNRQNPLEIVLIVVVFLSFVFYNTVYPQPGFLRKISLETVAILEMIINKPIVAAREAWRHYIYLVGLESENRKLRELNARLLAELIRYREGYREGQRLKELLGLKEKLAYRTVAARVIGRNPSLLFKMVIINRGESDGVTIGSPVVTTTGVLGRVTEVSWNNARVLLIIDENSNISVRLEESRVEALLQGASSGCSLKYVPKTVGVKEGEVVLTSGIGGVFPNGLPVGVVRRVDKKEAGLFQKIEVTPYVDPLKVEEVLVLSSQEKKEK